MTVRTLALFGLAFAATATLAETSTLDSFHGLKFGMSLNDQIHSCKVDTTPPCWDQMTTPHESAYVINLTPEDQQLFTNEFVREVDGKVAYVALIFDLIKYPLVKQALNDKFGGGEPSKAEKGEYNWKPEGGTVNLFILNGDEGPYGDVEGASNAYQQHIDDEVAARQGKLE